VDDHEPAAALGVRIDELAFGGLKVTADLTVNNDDVGLGELSRSREDVAALGQGTLGIQ
jgi:hypothetical protein